MQLIQNFLINVIVVEVEGEKKYNVLYKVIGNNVKEQREIMKLSQIDLARMIDMSRTSITNIENGNQRIKICTLYKIAIALKIDAHKFLN